MSLESSEQYSFNFEPPRTPPPRLEKKRRRPDNKELTSEETERLEILIQRALEHIEDPNNKRDAILRMSSVSDKREIARLRVWREFTGQSAMEKKDPFLR